VKEGRIGTVKWWKSQGGYGYITTAGGEQFFVSFTGINGTGWRSLEPGQKVSFEVVSGRYGPRAINVSVLPNEEWGEDQTYQADPALGVLAEITTWPIVKIDEEGRALYRYGFALTKSGVTVYFNDSALSPNLALEVGDRVWISYRPTSFDPNKFKATELSKADPSFQTKRYFYATTSWDVSDLKKALGGVCARWKNNPLLEAVAVRFRDKPMFAAIEFLSQLAAVKDPDKVDEMLGGFLRQHYTAAGRRYRWETHGRNRVRQTLEKIASCLRGG